MMTQKKSKQQHLNITKTTGDTMFDDHYEEDQELAHIRGVAQKKKDMGLLNQRKVSKWEMDELFSEDEYVEEF
jgi:hypothetical protein